MLAKVLSRTLLGVDAQLVEVEVDLSNGLPTFTTVGLPDAAIRESRDRIKAAMSNSGIPLPLKRITVNLAPAHLRKEGTAFDLPMALGILEAEGYIRPGALDQYVVVGELSLDGRVKAVAGVMPMAVSLRGAQVAGMIVPADNAAEAAVIDDVSIFAVRTLAQAIAFLNGEEAIERTPSEVHRLFRQRSNYAEDFADVKGQQHVKRALEVAAAGAHNLLMVGPPGSGKSLMARRIPSILPDMSLDEAIETSKIHSVAGLLGPDRALIATRPFRSPHHSTSDAGLIGGGHIPGPGEVSLAHHGVLFLDELPEFRRSVLEVMRQPLEDGQVTIARAAMTLTFPARFMLTAAMNPCPCGYATDPQHVCQCSAQQLQRYRARVSGPLLDRIDIHVEVPPVRYADLTANEPAEPSSAIRQRVNAARERQQARFVATSVPHNAAMGVRDIRQYCQLEAAGERLLEQAMQHFGLSARAYDRIRKVARTIADLEGVETISSTHLSEAIQYRTLDRRQ
ncbi:MAG: YifB family Mg chelatase-like AAA ATPase [bacterium]|nr:YifB family Mg chelatase-like AAA ATPase [bacterium]